MNSKQKEAKKRKIQKSGTTASDLKELKAALVKAREEYAKKLARFIEVSAHVEFGDFEDFDDMLGKDGRIIMDWDFLGEYLESEEGDLHSDIGMILKKSKLLQLDD